MRGASDEELRPVTLTRAFEIQQYELTQKQWTALGFANPSGKGIDSDDGTSPDCPVGGIAWLDAVSFANELSRRHTPPLEPCYELLGCTGTVGRDLTCTGVKLTKVATVYECAGYRLPTDAEWEIAARAGTRTTYYSGDIAMPSPSGSLCLEEPNLDPIAWYCANTKPRPTTRPVGQLRPNAFGLYDVLGNVFEWTSDSSTGVTPEARTDPGGVAGTKHVRSIRGGNVIGWPTLLRASSGLGHDWDSRGAGIGVRLARTLP